MATGTAPPMELGSNLQSGANINHSKIDNTRNVRAYRQGIKNCNDSIVCMTINAQSLKYKKDDLKIKAD